jgi:hypothetical protein
MFSCRTRGFCLSCHAKRLDIDHMKLTFVAAKPPPSHVFEQVALTAARRQPFRRLAMSAAMSSSVPKPERSSPDPMSHAASPR